jgi:hypothetical protein
MRARKCRQAPTALLPRKQELAGQLTSEPLKDCDQRPALPRRTHLHSQSCAREDRQSRVGRRRGRARADHSGQPGALRA